MEKTDLKELCILKSLDFISDDSEYNIMTNIFERLSRKNRKKFYDNFILKKYYMDIDYQP